MLVSRRFIHDLPLPEQLLIQSRMSLLGCDELYPAMPVLSVISADEAVHPLSRLAYIVEAIHCISAYGTATPG